ncbi:MAG: M3 family metallopeptidase [Bacteroidales bacterium]|nr:M3 family metallopeptidase [Bacteroidales bacterium]
MKTLSIAGLAALTLITSCTMNNPLLTESKLPYGAPEFDKIKNCHYIPAFEKGIEEGKAEIDAIVADTAEPDFTNTIEALEHSGKTLGRVSAIFFNLPETATTDEMEEIAVEITPMLNDFEMYVSLNEALFLKVKAVYEKKEELNLTREQERLLDKTYRGFVRNGALLSAEDKETYGKLQEELSLTQLKFGKNALAATNAFKMNLTDEKDLEGLPDFVREAAAQTARDNGQEGWTIDLTAPSYRPFMQYSSRRDLREKMYMAYNTKATDGEYDNTELCRQIVGLRIKIANLLGYDTWADYMVENRMVGSADNVGKFIGELLGPSLPAAKAEVAEVQAYAGAHGFEGELMPWDFSYWSRELKSARYELKDEELKPYFRLEDCIDAVLGLATRLYGITFEERTDIPGYHKDVHVFDVKDADGQHLALFYADFFPRASKRGGAWMTEFRGASVTDGAEVRPLVSIVTNFSKPTENSPSLLTHDELTTFLHEFGHSLHGMLGKGSYESMTGTSVDHDFVELPSQIMENWGYEKEFLTPFAKHYQTSEPIPEELIDRIKKAQNYQAAYAQVRQLQFGILDMSWYTLKELPEEGTLAFEKKVYAPTRVLPEPDGTCMSTTFGHIFTGGYSAGYYSYKWAEVLAADAFSLFEEKGIFNAEVASSFRNNILAKGSSEDEATLYRTFRGHDPQPEALLRQLGISK